MSIVGLSPYRRVAAIASITAEKVEYYGFGEYLGTIAIASGGKITSHHWMRLDNGQPLFGSQCVMADEGPFRSMLELKNRDVVLLAAPDPIVADSPEKPRQD